MQQRQRVKSAGAIDPKAAAVVVKAAVAEKGAVTIVKTASHQSIPLSCAARSHRSPQRPWKKS
jgi:hypothetical protein